MKSVRLLGQRRQAFSPGCVSRMAESAIMLCLALWLLSWCSCSLASDADDESGSAVVVTDSAASGLSPDFDSDQEKLAEIPAAVDVVSSEHYQTSRGAYLEDLLPYVPGLIIQPGQGSEDNKVSVRGSSVQSDEIAGLEILLDGIPINQADGEAFLQDLDLRDVKYAEIYRGADALRFGGVTLGGAVNLITMTGHDAPPLQAWLTAGSFGLFEEGLVSGWSSGPNDVLASLTNHSLDGFRDHTQENSQKLFLSFGCRISAWVENRFYAFYGSLNQNNPSSLTKQAMYADPKQTDPESVAQDWDTHWNYVRLIDRWLLKGSDWQIELAAYYNHRYQLQRQEYDAGTPLGLVAFASDDFGGDITFETHTELFGQRNRLTLGVLPAFEGEEDNSYQNLAGHAGSIISADFTFASNIVVYGENQHYLTKFLSILTGCQFVYVERNYRDRLDVPANGSQTNSEDYRSVNPKLGLLYEWSDHCQAYLNGSRSFQPPSFDESLEAAADGDQLFNRLEAQTAVTIEAGTRGEYSIFSWDLAIYHSWVDHELLDLTNGHGSPLGTVNARHTCHQGIESELETKLAHNLLVRSPNSEKQDRLTAQQTFTWSDFHFAGDPVNGDNRIAGTPVYFYQAEVRYQHPGGFYFAPNVEWSISKYPVDEANTLFADPYALLGVRAGYKSDKGFAVFFEAKNLTNKIYAATVEPVGDARIEGSDSFNPGNGRSFYGGVSWKW